MKWKQVTELEILPKMWGKREGKSSKKSVLQQSNRGKGRWLIYKDSVVLEPDEGGPGGRRRCPASSSPKAGPSTLIKEATVVPKVDECKAYLLHSSASCHSMQPVQQCCTCKLLSPFREKWSGCPSIPTSNLSPFLSDSMTIHTGCPRKKYFQHNGLNWRNYGGFSAFVQTSPNLLYISVQ